MEIWGEEVNANPNCEQGDETVTCVYQVTKPLPDRYIGEFRKIHSLFVSGQYSCDFCSL